MPRSEPRFCSFEHSRRNQHRVFYCRIARTIVDHPTGPTTAGGLVTATNPHMCLHVRDAALVDEPLRHPAQLNSLRGPGAQRVNSTKARPRSTTCCATDEKNEATPPPSVVAPRDGCSASCSPPAAGPVDAVSTSPPEGAALPVSLHTPHDVMMRITSKSAGEKACHSIASEPHGTS